MPTPSSAVAATSAPMSTTDPEIARVRKIASVLDNMLVDPILGAFVPGLGDVIGSVLGMYVVSIAMRRKLPAIVIARMLLNLTTDAAIGAVPVIGDLGDLVHRANTKNVALLEQRQFHGRSSWKDWAMVGGAFALLVGVVVGSVMLTLYLFRAIF